MGYIYDILLNFNKEPVEYFLWNEDDNIKYVKKIILYKVDTDILKDILNYDIEFDPNFTKNIPSYEMNGEKNSPKLVLLTDGLIVFGLIIKSNKVDSISRLLLDEEYEVLEASNHLEYNDIKYKKIKEKTIDKNNLTRYEKENKVKLEEKLDTLYKNKKDSELIYLYYEYTGLEKSNTQYIYNYLKNSLNDYNDKHNNLLNILLMTNKD